MGVVPKNEIPAIESSLQKLAPGLQVGVQNFPKTNSSLAFVSERGKPGVASFQIYKDTAGSYSFRDAPKSPIKVDYSHYANPGAARDASEEGSRRIRELRSKINIPRG